MNVSRRWLEAFLNRPLDSRELLSRLAMLGAPVDAIEPLDEALRPVVVGLVEQVVAHPNADRLRVCQVDIGGGERRQVVTGAPNVVEGGRYPFAGIGVTLPNGLTLEKRKLRGEVSEGMLCSADELALGTDHDGLLELTTDAPPGTPVATVLGLDDERLVLDIAPVRGDLTGHKGVARELAASYDVLFRLPTIPNAPSELPPFRRGTKPVETGGFEIAIEPGSSARRFTAVVIEGVTVGPSPAWLAARLESIGQRPINNVVDVTNYVMFELGQPFHAFDADRVRGGRLFARLASAGERLVTLDGVERTLDGSMTVVADGAGAVGVAGVMGGRDSEVHAGTTRVVLEGAWWSAAETRSTRRALGIASEAALRFERGTDLFALPDALVRAASIVIAVAGGRVVDAPADVWPDPTHPPRIFVRVARTSQILGLDVDIREIERTLTAIGCTVSPKPEEGRLAVDVPGWRVDLTTEIDLIEEVARIHGFDRLPDTLRSYRPGAQVDPPMVETARAVRSGMTALGLYEAITLPIGAATSERAIPIVNPLSADHGFLRERILPALVRQVESNWANIVRDVRLFELGTVFVRESGARRPAEATRLAGVVTGSRSPAHWTDSGSTPDLDWWDLKGMFEAAVSLANPGANVQVGDHALVARDPDGRELGWAGTIDADRPPWAAPLFGFEIEVRATERTARPFAAPAAVPAANRDLALVVPWSISAEKVEGVMARSGIGLLESVQVIDEYRGAGVPDGTRSVAFRLVFRGRDRTLRDREVDAAVSRIVTALGSELGVVLRTS